MRVHMRTRVTSKLCCAASCASTDFQVEWTMWNEGFQWLGKKIKSGLDDMGKAASKAIDDANKAIKP